MPQPPRKARRPTKTQRERQRALEHAAALGPLIPGDPGRGWNQHGEPQLGDDQVFVTKAGTAFHTGWCAIVIAISDEDPTRLITIDRTTVGRRQPCRTCRDQGPSGSRSLPRLTKLFKSFVRRLSQGLHTWAEQANLDDGRPLPDFTR